MKDKIKKILNKLKNNKWEKKYNYSNFQAFYNVLNESNISLQRNLNLLDFGCGDGRYSSIISKYFLKVQLYGVDIDYKLIENCNRNIKGNFFTNNIDPPLNFKNNFFDIAIAYSVFTHLKKDKIDKWFKELNRVLNHDGFLVFTFSSIDRLKFMNIFSGEDIVNSYGINDLEKFYSEYKNYYYYEFDSKTPEYVNTLIEIELIEKIADLNGFKVLKNYKNAIHAYPFGSHDVCVLKKIK